MNTLVDRDALEASLCRDSFYDFVQRFWSEIVPEEPVWNWHIKVLCDELQTAAELVFAGKPKKHDIVINIPPGTTKSLVCSVFFPAWVWTRMPTARSICASYSHPLALDLSRKSRDVVQSEKWKKLFGSVELREDQNTKGYFLNESGGSRIAVGTSGTITGFHGHFIIVDDPLDPNRAVSELELKTANRWVTETLKTRKVDKAVSLTILVMQRLHEDDPAANMLGRARDNEIPIRHINLPGEIDEKSKSEVRPRILARHYKDGLLDPVRLSRAVLTSLRPELGEYGYSGQILQRPVPLGGGMFKVERVLVDVPGPLKHFVRLCRYWDKAGTAGRGAYTVGALLGLDKAGRWWVLDIVRGQWESAQREAMILQTANLDRAAAKHVIQGLEQEPGSGGKESAEKTATMLATAGHRVRVDRPVGDKAMRADPFSVQVNMGNVRMKAGAWNRDYLNEMQFFPASKFKDQMDASSGAYAVMTIKKTRIGGLK